MNCTMDDLDKLKSQEQNKNLENILNLLQEKFDEKSIAITNLKSQFTFLKENENKYLQEINDLQSNEEDEVRNLKDKLKSLQEEFTCTEESFELELFNQDEKVIILQEELANLPHPDKEDVEESDKNASEEMFRKNLDLESQLEKLIHDKDETKLKLKDIEEVNENLSNNIHHLMEDLDHQQQALNCKSEEIRHSYKLLRETEEECVLTNNELKSLGEKSQSLADEGSIFSEVNNRRLNLKESISKLEIDSKNLVNKKLNVQKILSKFRSNHQKLENLSKSEMKDIQYDNECLFVYYKSRNNVLEDLVHIYNQIINEKLQLTSNGFPSDGLQYLHKYVDDIEGTIKKWQKSQNTRQLSLFMVSSDLRDSSLKLTEERNRSSQLESKITELEADIKNFKIKQKENIQPTSLNVAQNVPANLLVLDSKERKNANIEKKVAFAADILETKSSDSHQVKRGKVMKYTTIYVD